MIGLKIDMERLAELLKSGSRLPKAGELYRDGELFFVGGNLPLLETIETMYESHCQEATRLFYLTLEKGIDYARGVRMASEVKRNFHVRLMAQLPASAPAALIDQLYLAGVDLLNILPEVNDDPALLLERAAGVYPRWRVAVSGYPAAGHYAAEGRWFLDRGILPLPLVAASAKIAETSAALTELAAIWQRYGADLSAYLPLLAITSPLTPERPKGRLGGLIGVIREQGELVHSELRRHLRSVPASDSLDSAGL